MKLYDYWRSSSAYRVRIALAVKKLPYEAIQVDLTKDQQHQRDYLQKNPQGLVPTLIDQGQPMHQSLAIIEYLDETYPTPPLLPQSPLERVKIRAAALTIACDIHPLNNLRVLTTLRQEWQANEKQIQYWYHQWLKAGFDALEIQLAATPRKENFCFGDQISLADICLIPQVYNAKRFEFSLKPYPIIEAIDAHCQTLTPFIRSYPTEIVA